MLRTGSMLRTAAAFAAQLLWPARCAACDVLVAAEASFCVACAPTLLRLGEACPGCALPFTGVGCRRCASEPLPFLRARAALAYGGAIADAILRFKHGGHAHLARPLGRVFATALQVELPHVDALLPVPLHPRRLRARGFNQAIELVRGARPAGRPRGWPPLWPDSLRRIRDTPALGRHSPRERRALVAGAFAVPHPDRVRGARLLLVDDVMTTGATLAGCAHALREAGAAEVRVAVLARAL
jgi:ComF family protein